MPPTAVPKTPTAPEHLEHVPLSHAKLPRWAPWLVGLLAVALGLAVYLLTNRNLFLLVLSAFVVFVVALPAWSAAVENRRSATDRLMTTLVYGSLALALLPLVSLAWVVIQNGAAEMTWHFLTNSMRVPLGQPGGIYHAMIGTVLVTLTATIISAPDRHLHRHLPGRVRQQQELAGPLDHAPGRRDDRDPLHRRRALRLCAVHPSGETRPTGPGSAAPSPCRC